MELHRSGGPPPSLTCDRPGFEFLRFVGDSRQRISHSFSNLTKLVNNNDFSCVCIE